MRRTPPKILFLVVKARVNGDSSDVYYIVKVYSAKSTQQNLHMQRAVAAAAGRELVDAAEPAPRREARRGGPGFRDRMAAWLR